MAPKETINEYILLSGTLGINTAKGFKVISKGGTAFLTEAQAEKRPGRFLLKSETSPASLEPVGSLYEADTTKCKAQAKPVNKSSTKSAKKTSTTNPASEDFSAIDEMADTDVVSMIQNINTLDMIDNLHTWESEHRKRPTVMKAAENRYAEISELNKSNTNTKS